MFLNPQPRMPWRRRGPPTCWCCWIRCVNVKPHGHQKSPSCSKRSTPCRSPGAAIQAAIENAQARLAALAIMIGTVGAVGRRRDHHRRRRPRGSTRDDARRDQRASGGRCGRWRFANGTGGAHRRGLMVARSPRRGGIRRHRAGAPLRIRFWRLVIRRLWRLR